MNKIATPMIVWVVGDNTNVGKTTVSTALIRTFNKLGRPTVGFKPYAGASLFELIDFLEEIAITDGYLAGRDARALSEASPLTTTDLLETINPSWRLSYPTRDFGIFVRKGSDEIGMKSFLCTDNAKAIWTRPDLIGLNRAIQLPVNEMRSIGDITADKVDFQDQDIQIASFNRLHSLGPEIVVCEGAGRLLPVWVGTPIVRHIFFISSGNLYFFPEVSIKIEQTQGGFGPFTIAVTFRPNGAGLFRRNGAT